MCNRTGYNGCLVERGTLAGLGHGCDHSLLLLRDAGPSIQTSIATYNQSERPHDKALHCRTFCRSSLWAWHCALRHRTVALGQFTSREIYLPPSAPGLSTGQGGHKGTGFPDMFLNANGSWIFSDVYGSCSGSANGNRTRVLRLRISRPNP